MRRLADAGLTTREACGNSVRNITACPYAGVSADERFDVTPYAEGADAVPAASPAQLDAAAQVQDRLRGVRARITSRPRSTISASTPRSAPDGARGFRVLAGGGTAIMCKSAGVIHEFLPASGDPARRRSGAARVPAAGRLQAQAAQPDEVHDQGRSAGIAGTAEYERELAACRGRRRCRSSSIDPPAAEAAPAWARDEAPSPKLIASRVAAVPPDGPGITPTLVPVYMPGRRGLRAVARRPTSGRRSSSATCMATATVPLGDLTSEQMRVRRRAGARVRRRHRAGDGRSEPGVPVGQRRRRARAVSPAVGRQPRPRRGVQRLRTSRAARAPSRAAWR